MRRISRRRASLLLCVVLVAGCAQQDARPRTTQLAAPPVEYGVVHVHGLGIDPGDGGLYAATHTGLFRVAEDGTAERVANREQDTMGFTIVGPGRFLGSGHPDFREQPDLRPPLLGLIASDDAGVTWKSESLRGKADFHALTAAHGQVYGYDSTSATFMVSPDGTSWDRRSRRVMLDFAVDPTDEAVVIAATEVGLLRSGDGGRSWQPLEGAPSGLTIDWQASAPLMTVDMDGRVWASPDGGATWTPRGTVGGAPEAATATGDTVYVAVADRGILQSTDGGQTFTVRYAAPS